MNYDKAPIVNAAIFRVFINSLIFHYRQNVVQTIIRETKFKLNEIKTMLII